MNRSIIDKLDSEPLISLEIISTKFAGHAIELARGLSGKKVDVVVVVGGDGTLNEVVNGIKQSELSLPVALLPNGTANDFSRGLGQSWNPDSFSQAILSYNYQLMDLIRLSSDAGVHWCVNIADTGFGGNVVQLLHRQRKFIGGGISYVIAIARSFFTFKKPQVIIGSAEKNYAGPILLVAACNGPMFGDGLYIAPDALPNDGWMHVTLLGKVNFLDYVKNLARLKRKEKIKHPEACYFRTKKVAVQIMNGKAYTEADGELIGEGNMVFEIQEAALKLIVPLN